jgi:hypothetical protein
MKEEKVELFSMPVLLRNSYIMSTCINKFNNQIVAKIIINYEPMYRSIIVMETNAPF